MDKWYRTVGKHGDVVMSTRIRLARNLEHRPFPRFLSKEQRQEIVEAVKDAAAAISGLPLHFVDVATLPERERLALVERHLISFELANAPEGSGLLLSEDERVSVMINEEDHVRIQVMSAGLDLEGAYALADQVDSALGEKLHFAYDERLGFLTACPTNLGTGMRASLMLHLPALEEQGAIQTLENTVSKLGLTIRGSYGEGTRPHGALYQMSNQVTLGISEKAAIENLNGIAVQIMKQEISMRQRLFTQPEFEDHAWRSLGVLQTARILTYEEALRFLSTVRIAAAGGVLPSPTIETVTALMSDIQPGCLMTAAGEDMPPQIRDRRRAAMVRAALGRAE
ncbi:MAG: protein arginine kinase [Clostridia bacterium]|nr:protein arginine kinase [Clostridia bacterium]